MSITSFCLSTAAVWSLPSIPRHSEKKWSRQLLEDIDWFGAIIMSVGLGLLFYVLATTASSYTSIRSAPSVAILVVSVLLLHSFPFWMHYQTARGKPALIPNRLWRQACFIIVCIAVFFCWASLNGIEYFTTL
jgi:drug/metabolite transporter (DMT)-like permease